MATPQSTEGLTESYVRWRSSRLGQITDVLEQQLLFELLGSVADKTLLDVGCGDGALETELARHGFEKGVADGVEESLRTISLAAGRWRVEWPS